MVYETSNRDARVWGWDSYLCEWAAFPDGEDAPTESVYVKRHRGAPVQRALAAGGPRRDMIYWYTYGPDM